MLSLGVLKESDRLNKLFKENSLEINNNSGCVTAVCGDEILGYCLYDMTDKQIIIRFITPQDDLPLADGILRSTLHVAACRYVTDARYESNDMQTFFEKLGFVISESEKTLDMDKLFRSCK